MAESNGVSVSRIGVPDVVVEPTHAQAESLNGPFSLILQLASVADDMPSWGAANPKQRDIALRNFWPTEPILASAIYSVAARYAAFGFTLDGPPRTVKLYQDILQGVERGDGWSNFITKVAVDYLTQDNGAFILVLRAEDAPASPTVSMRHLESNRCIRTGRPEEPVVYTDRLGKRHLLKWYQVIPLAELPSGIELLNGMQVCAVSRLLRAAQVMRDISIYYREKISGRDPRAMHFVSGISHKAIEQHLTRQQDQADTRGRLRYVPPTIIGSVDPSANVDVSTIELASLPDSFNYEEMNRWYINQVALATGQDYQDFAPLPGGNLGSAQQSSVLHMKSRGKGARLFMTNIEHALNFRGILPSTLHFSYGDQDPAADKARAELELLEAKTRQIQISSGEISLEVARQIASDRGQLSREYLAALGGVDPVPHAIISSGDDPPEGPNAYDDVPRQRSTFASPALTAAKAQEANAALQKQAAEAATATARQVPNGPAGSKPGTQAERLTNAPAAAPPPKKRPS